MHQPGDDLAVVAVICCRLPGLRNHRHLSRSTSFVMRTADFIVYCCIDSAFVNCPADSSLDSRKLAAHNFRQSYVRTANRKVTIRDGSVRLYRIARPRRVRRRHAERSLPTRSGGLGRSACSSSPRPHQKADGEALAASLGDRLRGALLERHHAHARRGDRGCAGRGEARRRRLPGGARRRLDDRARQGDRAQDRPAADRHPDHLCRLRDDADPRRDEGRQEDHAAHR